MIKIKQRENTKWKIAENLLNPQFFYIITTFLKKDLTSPLPSVILG